MSKKGFIKVSRVSEGEMESAKMASNIRGFIVLKAPQFYEGVSNVATWCVRVCVCVCVSVCVCVCARARMHTTRRVEQERFGHSVAGCMHQRFAAKGER